jgi:hypothetical protein
MFDETSALGMLMNNIEINSEHMLSLTSGYGNQVEEEKKEAPMMQNSRDYLHFINSDLMHNLI